MTFDLFTPTRVISGRDCVVNNAERFAEFGKKCLIITDKVAAVKSGALADVERALDSQGIAHRLFDEVGQNPLISVCEDAASSACAFGADFLIGIGGGSCMDAAKAAAFFMTNPIHGAEIFDRRYNDPTPILLIGTTAGTGSEISPFAVLTDDATGRKGSYKDLRSNAVYAFGDPKYTLSLPYNFTVSTALDAMAHALEGYFSQKADELSDLFALRACELVLPTLLNFEANRDIPLTYEQRERLYYGSLYAGYTLSRVSTTYCHGLGYFLTEEYHMPHGFACAVFLPALLEDGQRYMPEKMARLLKFMRMSREEFVGALKKLTVVELPKIDDAKIAELVARPRTLRAAGIAPGNFGPQRAEEILRGIFQ